MSWFWGRRNYFEKYPKFSDIWNPDTKAAMFEGTSYPEWFQRYVYLFFYDRRIGTEDVSQFIRWFNRNLLLDEWQFLQYLRIQTTEFDPMVTNYVEHWIRSYNKGFRTTDNESILDGSTISETESEQDVTQRTTGQTESTFNTNRTQTDSSNTSTEQTARTETASEGKSEQVVESDAETKNHQDTNTRSLQADLPQTAAYGEAGLPPNLNWSYASSQSETEGTSDTEETSTGTTTTSGTNSEQSDSTTTTTGTSDTDTTGKTTGTDTTNGETTQNVTGKNTGTGKTTVTNKGGNTGSSKENSETEQDVKDWTTGRGGAPQDLLNSARNYILKTNASRWLLDKLQTCFMEVYD